MRKLANESNEEAEEEEEEGDLSSQLKDTRPTSRILKCACLVSSGVGTRLRAYTLASKMCADHARTLARKMCVDC